MIIHLDTNVLAALVEPHSGYGKRAYFFLEKKHLLACNAVAWSEFLTGSTIQGVSNEMIAHLETVMENRILPFRKEDALLAARLYNVTGRRRGSRIDCFLASSAILANAAFATENQNDFLPFVSYGLRLI